MSVSISVSGIHICLGQFIHAPRALFVVLLISMNLRDVTWRTDRQPSSSVPIWNTMFITMVCFRTNVIKILSFQRMPKIERKIFAAQSGAPKLYNYNNFPTPVEAPLHLKKINWRWRYEQNTLHKSLNCLLVSWCNRAPCVAVTDRWLTFALYQNFPEPTQSTPIPFASFIEFAPQGNRSSCLTFRLMARDRGNQMADPRCAERNLHVHLYPSICLFTPFISFFSSLFLPLSYQSVLCYPVTPASLQRNMMNQWR